MSEILPCQIEVLDGSVVSIDINVRNCLRLSTRCNIICFSLCGVEKGPWRKLIERSLLTRWTRRE